MAPVPIAAVAVRMKCLREVRRGPLREAMFIMPSRKDSVVLPLSSGCKQKMDGYPSDP
jgi:hypothetical protein